MNYAVSECGIGNFDTLENDALLAFSLCNASTPFIVIGFDSIPIL